MTEGGDRRAFITNEVSRMVLYITRNYAQLQADKTAVRTRNVTDFDHNNGG